MILDFAKHTDSYRPLGGRTVVKEDGLYCDYAATGVEFSALCRGKVTLTLTSGCGGYLAIFADGQPLDRARYEAGTQPLVIAEDLPEGRHTIRILRDSDMDTLGARLVFATLELEGEDLRPTPEKPLYIEFVGDSITTGKGVMAPGTYQADDPKHSATHAYAYLTAQALDADWSLMARGGIGLCKPAPRSTLTMVDIYDYESGFADRETLYSFPRKADLVVLALGTNDGSVYADALPQAFRQIVQKIRAAHGQDVPLVFMYGMMAGNWQTLIPAMAQELGGYCLKTSQHNDGSSSKPTSRCHPGMEGARTIAAELTAYLKTLKI